MINHGYRYVCLVRNTHLKAAEILIQNENPPKKNRTAGNDQIFPGCHAQIQDPNTEYVTLKITVKEKFLRKLERIE